jgi:hypothetical protein
MVRNIILVMYKPTLSINCMMLQHRKTSGFMEKPYSTAQIQKPSDCEMFSKANMTGAGLSFRMEEAITA